VLYKITYKNSLSIFYTYIKIIVFLYCNK